jgi:predicted NBD/HSP70 family sugar kinase
MPNAERPSSGTVTTTSAVRVVNERAVFDAVRTLGTVSTADLVAATGLSKPTIVVAVADLERAGLIDQVGRRTGKTGRAPRMYRLSSQAGAVVAIDVGRAWVRVAVVDLAGAVLARDEQRSHARSATALIRQITELAHHLVRDADLEWDRVTLTVLGTPGVYDDAADVVRLAPNLPGWSRPGVVKQLRQRLPGSFQIENDINLAAVAEMAHLVAESAAVPDMVFLSAGTGLGLGIVVNGRLLRGAHGAAGEISYLPMDPAGAQRRVRGPESLEQLTAPAELVKQARRWGLASARGPEDVFDAARAGSRAAQRAVRTEAQRLATAIAGVTAVLDPGLVVLGGGIGHNGDLLVDPIRAALTDLVPLAVPELRVSDLGTDAPLLGAVATGVERARHLAFDAAFGRVAE